VDVRASSVATGTAVTKTAGFRTHNSQKGNNGKYSSYSDHTFKWIQVDTEPVSGWNVVILSSGLHPLKRRARARTHTSDSTATEYRSKDRASNSGRDRFYIRHVQARSRAHLRFYPMRTGGSLPD